MPYCAYLRKSRKDLEYASGSDSETLARHKTILLSLASRMGVPIDRYYEEVVSGETIVSRPVMQELLRDVESNLWDGVFVVEVERLARGDSIDQGIVAQTFKYSNTRIITPAKTYDPNNEFDEEYFEFGLFMSRREYKTINRRQQAGRISSTMEGKYVGNKPPYGYRRVKLEGIKGFSLEPDPEQADIVKMIFDLYVNGELQPDGSRRQMGCMLIARKLSGLGVPTVNGKPWSLNTVRGILTNPTYMGKIRWGERKNVKKMQNGQIVKSRPRNYLDEDSLPDGLQEPLVSRELWKAAKLIRTSGQNRPVIGEKTMKNPLSGLMVCKKCGQMMVRRPYSNGYPDGLICNNPYCDNHGSMLCYVEEAVIDGLQKWVNTYSGAAGSLPVSSSDTLNVLQAAQKKAQKELLALIEQRNKLFDLLERGVYDDETFLQRRASIEERVQEQERELDKLKRDLDAEITRDNNRRFFVPKVENVIARYDTISDPEERNHLLRAVLNKVTYQKDVFGKGHEKDFVLQLFVKSE